MCSMEFDFICVAKQMTTWRLPWHDYSFLWSERILDPTVRRRMKTRVAIVLPLRHILHMAPIIRIYVVNCYIRFIVILIDFSTSYSGKIQPLPCVLMLWLFPSRLLTIYVKRFNGYLSRKLPLPFRYHDCVENATNIKKFLNYDSSKRN